ncbi:hypothetical protein OAO87_02085 [bacterium]|nr:hypothetical protein [bacterium]
MSSRALHLRPFVLRSTIIVAARDVFVGTPRDARTALGPAHHITQTMEEMAARIEVSWRR